MPVAAGAPTTRATSPRPSTPEIRRLQRRFRALPIALGTVVAALAIIFTLTGNIIGVFFLMPVAIIGWFVFIRPTHQKRYREAIAELPRWDLRADVAHAAGGWCRPNAEPWSSRQSLKRPWRAWLSSSPSTSMSSTVPPSSRTRAIAASMSSTPKNR